MTEMERWLAGKADVLDARGLTRNLQIRESDDDVIDLAGNDYLGLATDPRVIEAAVEAARTWGTGAMASRLVSGTTRLHAALETALAKHLQMPAALVFSSGYLANFGVVTALGGPDCLLIADAHVHASLVDACRLARSPVVQVPHNDVAAVTAALATRSERRAMVLTESVFSVLGDAAPLIELAGLCAEHEAVLLVDEAHGVGVTGEGWGSVAGAGLGGSPHVVVTATLSKALGSQGGAVLGSESVVRHLVSRARSFVFDTALAPPAVGAAIAALEIIRTESRHEEVLACAGRIAAACGVQPAAGAVVSVPMPSPQAAVGAARACLAEGVRVGAFRPPSVPDGVSRLRITARARLNATDLDRACGVLSAVVAANRT
jgi:8-amino-7-oxononanoate synthase